MCSSLSYTHSHLVTSSSDTEDNILLLSLIAEGLHFGPNIMTAGSASTRCSHYMPNSQSHTISILKYLSAFCVRFGTAESAESASTLCSYHMLNGWLHTISICKYLTQQ